MEIIFSVPDLVLTQDGSYTLFSKDHGVTYHSKYGAIQESNHVFIQAGLNHFLNKRDDLSVLEIGFGTGLNTLLTWKNISGKENFTLRYQAFDIYPLPKETLNLCSHQDFLKLPENILEKILFSPWDESQWIDSQFLLTKNNKNIVFEILPFNTYDLVYFDAFSPESQPELWTLDIFKKIYDSMKDEGALVTYCAKGEVKRTLKKIGFKLESLPGPPGKREMTRAIK